MRRSRAQSQSHEQAHAQAQPSAQARAQPPRVLGRFVKNFSRGFAMGAADIVPGVSGGTVALLLGIYRRLLGQLQAATLAAAAVAVGRFSDSRNHLRRLDVWFLLGLLAGIATAILALASVMSELIKEHPVPVSAAFFGMVAASVVVVRKRVSAWFVKDRWRPAAPLLVFILTTAIAFFALGLRSQGVSDPPWVVFFLAGAVTICAMILPGISGALLLLLIGLYDDVIDAVNGRDLATVALFAVGAALGLALFSNVLARLLERHYNITLAALMGLMAGSLRVLWPWPATATVAGQTELTGIENVALGAPVASQVPLAAVLCVVAFIAVLTLVRLTGSLENR